MSAFLRGIGRNCHRKPTLAGRRYGFSPLLTPNFRGGNLTFSIPGCPAPLWEAVIDAEACEVLAMFRTVELELRSESESSLQLRL